MVRVIFQANVHDRVGSGSWVEVPQLHLHHCVVEDFKCHAEWKRFIYSQKIDDVLEAHVDRLLGQTKILNLNAIPEGVSVDVFGSLAIVTLNLP